MNGLEDKARFNTVLVWLAKRMMAPGGLPKKIDADLQDDYFEALRAFPIQKIEWGAKHLFATEKWFPMPCEIKAAAILAPSSVMPAIAEQPRPMIEEFTEEQVRDARQKLDNLIAGFDDWGEVPKSPATLRCVNSSRTGDKVSEMS